MNNQTNDNPISLNGDSDTITGNNINISVTTTSSTFLLNYSKKVESVKFIENEEGNFIEVISSETPMHGTITYTNYSSSGKSMIKERYGVKDGKLQLIKVVRGTENPGYYVPSVIEWKE